MHRMTGADRDLLRRKHLMEQVLELWVTGAKSTFCIAEQLGASEREVCRIISEADGREEKFEEAVE